MLKMMHFLLLQKLITVPLKNCFCLALIIPGKCKYTCTCKYIPQGLSDGFWWFSLVPLGYPWLSFVILGYPWLSLVSLSYPWLVILGYTWLSTIQINVKLFVHLKLSFPSFAEICCSHCQIKWPWCNQW